MVIHDARRQNALQEILPFYLNHITIKQVHEMEYIGLAVDDSLNWDEQYKSVKGRG